MKCPDCGTMMKPLATSLYCPNDCDRAVTEEIDPEKTPQVIFWDGSGMRLVGGGGGGGMNPQLTPSNSTGSSSDPGVNPFDWMNDTFWDTD